MSETKTVMMPRELTHDDAIAVRVMATKRMRVSTEDFKSLFDLSPSAIAQIYRAAVELLGE